MLNTTLLRHTECDSDNDDAVMVMMAMMVVVVTTVIKMVTLNVAYREVYHT